MLQTVFLDRDGVINRKRPEGDYVTTWEEFEFLPDAAVGLRLLHEAGLRLIVVTNQRGIALGRLSEADLQEIHQRMRAELAQCGVHLDGIYHCPHDRGQCDCRKPALGLFLKARHDFPGIDFAKSAMVGDSVTDLEAGTRLGCRCFLVADPTRRDAILVEAKQQGLAAPHCVPSLVNVAEILLPVVRPRPGAMPILSWNRPESSEWTSECDQ
jgi:D-glycero-D-manno-heptose 1,7-bisphosphate phosphatase